jgi:NTP pyrophosphatase (non-canonical NTP hydrolase)
MSDIKKLQDKVIKFRDDRNWKQFHNPKDMAISLTLEATEFLEHFQWKNQQEIDEMLKNDKIGASEELADVLHWVLLIAADLNIDLDKTLIAKLKKNEAKYPISKSKGNHKKYTEL